MSGTNASQHQEQTIRHFPPSFFSLSHSGLSGGGLHNASDKVTTGTLYAMKQKR